MIVKMISLLLPIFLFSAIGLHSVSVQYTSSDNRLLSDKSFVIPIPEELKIQLYNDKLFIPLPDNYESIDRGFSINTPYNNDEIIIQAPIQDGEQPSVSISDTNGSVILIQSNESEK